MVPILTLDITGSLNKVCDPILAVPAIVENTIVGSAM
jgi:hypothetical protein